MKNVAHILKYVGLAVGVASILAIANRLAAEGQRGKVTFEDNNGVLIHPGTNISTNDEKAMNDVLKRYNKSLYKIQTYKDGKLQQTKGRLSDVLVDKATRSELATAAGGGSFKAIQIIEISSPSKMMTASQPAATPTGPSRPPFAPAPTPTGPSRPPSSPAPTPTSPNKNPIPTRKNQPLSESNMKELVERLRPILEKYSK